MREKDKRRNREKEREIDRDKERDRDRRTDGRDWVPSQSEAAPTCTLRRCRKRSRDLECLTVPCAPFTHLTVKPLGC